MGQVVFSSWGRNIVDNRKGGEPKDATFRLPTTFDGERSLSAFMGWDGIILYNKDVDVPQMAAEYMKRVQTQYVCGKCTPGKKGTRVLMDALARIVAGQGTESDLAAIEDVAGLLKNCKCTLCPSSAVPVRDAVEHFRDDFLAYISGSRPAAAGNLRYVEKYTAPCQDKCPAHIDIPAYIEAIKDYRFAESLEVIRDNMPLPSVCGRVCPHPCEAACRRNLVDEPVAINFVKRFASDWDRAQDQPWQPRIAEPTGKRIAVVGAGPSGLSTAYYSAIAGHSVTVFEKQDHAGGMLRYGIPEYRLPKATLDEEIGLMQAIGVQIVTGKALGTHLSLEDLRRDFDAVYLAIGSWRASPMRIDGEHLEGVELGIDYLRHVTKGVEIDLGETVIVIGGGNTAIDCARTALRKGAKNVKLVYRRTRDEMPAEPFEVEEALHEGVEMVFLTAPTSVTAGADGRKELHCVRMELGEPDASGRRRPVRIPGSERRLSGQGLYG